MAEHHHFEPVDFEETKARGLRPLFVGKLAKALDSFVGMASLLVGIALVFGAVGILIPNLYSAVDSLASRGAWLTLSVIAVLVLLAGVFFWRATVITRLVLIMVLSIAALIASPFLEKLLT